MSVRLLRGLWVLCLIFCITPAVAEALEVPVDKLVPDRLQVHMEEEEKSRRELLAIVGSLGTEDVEALLMVARRFEVPQKKAV